MTPKHGIAFVGDLTVDRYPAAGKERFGGASLNGAIWAKRSGENDVSIVAAVGDDRTGLAFQKEIQERGIRSDMVRVMPGATSSIEILLDACGNHRWGEWNAGVLTYYHLGKQEADYLQNYKAVALTIYGKTSHLLPEMAAWMGPHTDRPFVTVNFDDLSQFDHSTGTVESHIDAIDAGFFGLNEKNDTDLIDALKHLSARTGKLLVVTVGSHGALAWLGKDEYSSPAIPVSSIVDTTGAGDAFLAGFLVCYLKTHSVQKSLVAGNETAVKKIQAFGAY